MTQTTGAGVVPSAETWGRKLGFGWWPGFGISFQWVFRYGQYAGSGGQILSKPQVYRLVVKPPEIGRIEDRILFSQAAVLVAEDFGDFLQT